MAQKAKIRTKTGIDRYVGRGAKTKGGKKRTNGRGGGRGGGGGGGK